MSVDIAKVEKTLRKADEAYYNGDKPTMTDSEYDKLREYFRKVDPNNSYFLSVGASVPKHREEVNLLMHMGSQNKAKDEKEMKDWYDKYNQPEIVISDKLDGSSIEVVYRDGELFRAATRGDGTVGMNVTRNAKLWKGLPKTITVKSELIIRGEAQLSVADWKDHFPDAVNLRNGGNGVVACDSDYKRNEHITFHSFDIVHPDVEFKKQSHKFKALKSLGFQTVRWFRCKCWEEVEKCRQHYIDDRSSLDFEIDGMVAGIDDLEVQEELGYSDGGSRPRGQIAWKFDTEKAETKVTGMTLTIGHTGRIIPTATLEPVQLAGTTVSNCLLNNFQYIEDLNLNVGDIVEVEKGGDIIPHINRVVHKNSKGTYQPPTDWKGYPLVREGCYWKVVDEDCPDLNFQRIRNWVNKTNIKQLGDTALLAMVDDGMVKDVDDLYILDEVKVAALPVGKGVIGSNAKKIIKEVDKTREMTIDIFIGSLSIKHLGRTRAGLLINHGFDNVGYYLNVDASNFIGKPCSDTGKYGPDVAHEIYESLKKRRDLIQRLSKHVKIAQPKKKVVDGKLSGQTFCFSGVRMKPDQKEIFEDLGGEESSKVNSDLTYLVLNDSSSTSKKVEKARKLGIKIISLEDFEKILE